MDIHHVGYLVKKIDKAAREFEQLGFVYENVTRNSQNKEKGTISDGNETVTIPYIFDETRQCKIAFMINGAYRIELVEPQDEKSPIYGLMKKYKNSPYHICYSTDNMENTISVLEKNGWILFERPQPAPAIDNCNVAFLMGSGSGMIELLEDASKD